MADHGEAEYAAATGDDYEEHEGAHDEFLLFASVGAPPVGIAGAIAYLASILVASTVGGVLGAWWTAGVISLFAVITAFYGIATNANAPGLVVFALSSIALAAYGLGLG
jgi:hypothetical protein